MVSTRRTNLSHKFRNEMYELILPNPLDCIYHKLRDEIGIGTELEALLWGYREQIADTKDMLSLVRKGEEEEEVEVLLNNRSHTSP